MAGWIPAADGRRRGRRDAGDSIRQRIGGFVSFFIGRLELGNAALLRGSQPAELGRK